MSDRCEPPEELRERDGWHWLQFHEEEPQVVRWQHEGIWVMGTGSPRPAYAANLGYRYLSPVLTPAEVAALKAERDKLYAERTLHDTPAWQANEALNEEVCRLRDALGWMRLLAYCYTQRSSDIIRITANNETYTVQEIMDMGRNALGNVK